MLIVWSRALSGRVRDPLVGGHLLISACVGGCWALLIASERALVEAFGWGARHSVLSGRIAEKLISGRAVLAGYLDAVPQAVVQGLLFLLLLAVLRTVVRSPRWAAALSALALLPLVVPHGAHMFTAWLFMGVGVVGLAVWLMIRCGLVALSTALFVLSVLNAAPMTSDVGAWYSDITLYALMIVGGIVLYGFAVARQPAPAKQPGVTLSA
jgi:hypothetical protein